MRVLLTARACAGTMQQTGFSIDMSDGKICMGLQGAFDDRPLAQLLQQEGLAKPLRDALLYAIAMADADQEPAAAPAESACLPQAPLGQGTASQPAEITC